MNSKTSTKHFKPEKLQRPSHARDFGANFKLHLRLETIGARTYHVLSPRPGTQVAWSTNYYHETWHIISGESSAHYLARLLWGLAFQKQPNTLIYLGGEFLRPTPFDGEPSDPIVLAPSYLTPLDAKYLKILCDRMRHPSPPDGTVRWQTWGLDVLRDQEAEYADYEHRHWEKAPWSALHHRENKEEYPHEVMRRVGGCVCYCAPPMMLQVSAYAAVGLRAIYYGAERTNHLELVWWNPYRRGSDGEIQIFEDYKQMVRDAERARRELEEERGATLPCTERERLRVYARRAKIERQRAHSRVCRQKHRLGSALADKVAPEVGKPIV